MDLDFSGMFEKTPLEKAEERKRLHAVPHSIDVMLVTAVILGLILVPTIWHFVGGLASLATIVAVLLALFLNNYLMYNAAYRDGFRSGYTTAQEDHADLGFVPERMDDHLVYDSLGNLIKGK
jgi:hypothetical protein